METLFAVIAGSAVGALFTLVILRAGASRARHDATLENIQLHFGLVATANEVESAWTRAVDSAARKEEARV